MHPKLLALAAASYFLGPVIANVRPREVSEGLRTLTTLATLASPVNQIPTTELIYPNIIPRAQEPAGCVIIVDILWKEPGWEQLYPRTLNQCYPKLVMTCERQAKVAYAKWRDMCAMWQKYKLDKHIEKWCNWKTLPKPGLVREGGDPDSIEYRVPGPYRCCDEPWKGVEPKRHYYSNDKTCDEFTHLFEWEYDYYTQNFPFFGVFDESYPYDNLTTATYNPKTNSKGVVW